MTTLRGAVIVSIQSPVGERRTRRELDPDQEPAKAPSKKRRNVPMSQRLRFGIFLAPFHKPGINPTLALQGDLDLIQWLDRCGYDEAWLFFNDTATTEIYTS